jgi:hypothetical protein
VNVMTLQREMLQSETFEASRKRIACCVVRVPERNAVCVNREEGDTLKRGHRTLKRRDCVATLERRMLQTSRGAACHCRCESARPAIVKSTMAGNGLAQSKTLARETDLPQTKGLVRQSASIAFSRLYSAFRAFRFRRVGGNCDGGGWQPGYEAGKAERSNAPRSDPDRSQPGYGVRRVIL